MRSRSWLALLVVLFASAPAARAQVPCAANQTCSANAPQVCWTIGTKSSNGTFNTVATTEIQNIISDAECICDTTDLLLVGTVNKAVTTPVTPVAWVGTSCDNIISQPSSCEQIVTTVTQNSFFSGAGAGSRPAQQIPASAVISPRTTQNTMPHACIQSASIANNMYILFPFNPSMPDSCVVPLSAKTTHPAPPTSFTADTGDEAATLHWDSPPVGTPDMPVYFQVLCIDQFGNPIPGQGAYGFGDPTGPPHQLAYSTCIDPANHVIQRRFIALTAGTGVVDGGTTDDAGAGATGGGSGIGGSGPLQIEADPLDGGVQNPDMTPATAADAARIFGNFDRKFVCSDRIAVVGGTQELRIQNLKNGVSYTFVVLGVDKWGNATPSNVASATPLPVQDLYRRFLAEGGTPQGFCFIATAAYGSYQHPYVQVLREFRDRSLLSSAWGRAFVAWYYRASPPWAAYIAAHPVARALVRVGLWPVIALAWTHLHLSAPEELLVFSLLVAWLALALRLRRARLRRRGAEPLGGAA